MIKHTVSFTLKKTLAAEEIKTFFEALLALSNIPGIRDFEPLKQISVKNKFDYGLSMLFENNDAYQLYNNHPDHVAFVQDLWIPCVEDFLEADFTALQPGDIL